MQRSAFLLLVLLTCSHSHAWKATDMWWNEQEPGWGLNLSQQGTKLFSTFFVYGSDNKATFYVAPDSTCAINNDLRTCSGKLYQTTGPAFAVTFNPSQVQSREVGSFAISFPTVSTANLTYSVDGVSVQKSLKRFSFTPRNIVGTYFGAYVTRRTSCAVATNNFSESPGFFQFTLSPNPDAQATGGISWVEVAVNGFTCNHTGTYAQEGGTYRFNTSFSCNDGSRGTQVTSALDFSDEGFKGLLRMEYSEPAGCIETGSVTGVRAVDNGN
jgi:hypothetical protein